MNLLLAVVAWVVLVMIALETFTGPFLLGKERSPFTAEVYVTNLAQALCCVLLAGRALRWW